MICRYLTFINLNVVYHIVFLSFIVEIVFYPVYLPTIILYYDIHRSCKYEDRRTVHENHVVTDSLE